MWTVRTGTSLDIGVRSVQDGLELAHWRIPCELRPGLGARVFALDGAVVVFAPTVLDAVVVRIDEARP